MRIFHKVNGQDTVPIAGSVSAGWFTSACVRPGQWLLASHSDADTRGPFSYD